MRRPMLWFVGVFIVLGALVYVVTYEEVETVSGDVLFEEVDINSIENVSVERHMIDSEYRYETAEIDNQEWTNTLFQSIDQSTLKPFKGHVFGLRYVIRFEADNRSMSLRFSDGFITAGIEQSTYQLEDSQALIETLKSFDLTWETP